jgi:hypothetical protein
VDSRKLQRLFYRTASRVPSSRETLLRTLELAVIEIRGLAGRKCTGGGSGFFEDIERTVVVSRGKVLDRWSRKDFTGPPTVIRGVPGDLQSGQTAVVAGRVQLHTHLCNLRHLQCFFLVLDCRLIIY